MTLTELTGGKSLELNEVVGTNTIKIAASGRLDTNTSIQLENLIKERSPNVTSLILDLSGIEYISSAGLRVVLLAHKTMLAYGGKMTVQSPSEFCTQVFQATGMESVLNIQQ